MKHFTRAAFAPVAFDGTVTSVGDPIDRIPLRGFTIGVTCILWRRWDRTRAALTCTASVAPGRSTTPAARARSPSPPASSTCWALSAQTWVAKESPLPRRDAATLARSPSSDRCAPTGVFGSDRLRSISALKRYRVPQVITALGRTWHPEHFTCAHCNQELGTRNFFEKDGRPYCEPDYHNLFSPRCAYCNGPILDVSFWIWTKYFVPQSADNKDRSDYRNAWRRWRRPGTRNTSSALNAVSNSGKTAFTSATANLIVAPITSTCSPRNAEDVTNPSWRITYPLWTRSGIPIASFARFVLNYFLYRSRQFQNSSATSWTLNNKGRFSCNKVPGRV